MNITAEDVADVLAAIRDEGAECAFEASAVTLFDEAKPWLGGTSVESETPVHIAFVDQATAAAMVTQWVGAAEIGSSTLFGLMGNHGFEPKQGQRVLRGPLELVPNGLPEPLTVSDFKNGVYSINGVAKTLAEMWEQNADWGGVFTAADVVAGVGMRKIGSKGQNITPAATAAHYAALDPTNGYTIVVDYRLSRDGGDVQPRLMIGPADPVTWLAGIEYRAEQNNTCISTYNDWAVEVAAPSLGPLHRDAFTLAPGAGLTGAARDGAAVIDAPDPTSENFAAMTMLAVILGARNAGATGISTSIIERITIYPAQPFAALPALASPTPEPVYTRGPEALVVKDVTVARPADIPVFYLLEFNA